MQIVGFLMMRLISQKDHILMVSKEISVWLMSTILGPNHLSFLLLVCCYLKTRICSGRERVPSIGDCFVLFVLFSCYFHQSISDYSWEVYIVYSGVFAG